MNISKKLIIAGLSLALSLVSGLAQAGQQCLAFLEVKNSCDLTITIPAGNNELSIAIESYASFYDKQGVHGSSKTLTLKTNLTNATTNITVKSWFHIYLWFNRYEQKLISTYKFTRPKLSQSKPETFKLNSYTYNAPIYSGSYSYLRIDTNY